MSDTPRTDDNITYMKWNEEGLPPQVDADFARQLERELVVARNALTVIAEHGGLTVSHEEHDGFPPTECDGAWCAEQARAALELTKGGAQ